MKTLTQFLGENTLLESVEIQHYNQIAKKMHKIALKDQDDLTDGELSEWKRLVPEYRNILKKIDYNGLTLQMLRVPGFMRKLGDKKFFDTKLKGDNIFFYTKGNSVKAYFGIPSKEFYYTLTSNASLDHINAPHFFIINDGKRSY